MSAEDLTTQPGLSVQQDLAIDSLAVPGFGGFGSPDLRTTRPMPASQWAGAGG